MRNNLKVYALAPAEFRQLLEANGVMIEKLAGKLFTMPLALSPKQMTSEKYSTELFNQIMKIELELSNRLDAVAIGGHFQAIGYKR